MHNVWRNCWMTSLEMFSSASGKGAPAGRAAWSTPSRANKVIYIYSASRGWILYPWSGLERYEERERGREPRRARERRRENVGEKKTARLSIRKNRNISTIDSCVWSVPDPIKWPQSTIECPPCLCPPCSIARERLSQKIIALLIHSFVRAAELGLSRISLWLFGHGWERTIKEQENDAREKKKRDKTENENIREEKVILYDTLLEKLVKSTRKKRLCANVKEK